MAERRRILVYGNSLVVEGVGASLRRAGGFDVFRVDPPLPGPSGLEDMAPDVVLFDVEGQHPEPVLALLESLPGLLVLGLSPDGNVTRLWTGRRYHDLTTGDLAALLDDIGVDESTSKARLVDVENGRTVWRAQPKGATAAAPEHVQQGATTKHGTSEPSAPTMVGKQQGDVGRPAP